MNVPRVVVLSRAGCHLCDVALDVVAQVCADLGEDYAVVDIDSDPALRARHSDDVPVVSVDGRVIARWRVSPQQVRVALASRAL